MGEQAAVAKISGRRRVSREGAARILALAQFYSGEATIYEQLEGEGLVSLDALRSFRAVDPEKLEKAISVYVMTERQRQETLLGLGGRYSSERFITTHRDIVLTFLRGLYPTERFGFRERRFQKRVPSIQEIEIPGRYQPILVNRSGKAPGFELTFYAEERRRKQTGVSRLFLGEFKKRDLGHVQYLFGYPNNKGIHSCSIQVFDDRFQRALYAAREQIDSLERTLSRPIPKTIERV